MIGLYQSSQRFAKHGILQIAYKIRRVIVELSKSSEKFNFFWEDMKKMLNDPMRYKIALQTDNEYTIGMIVVFEFLQNIACTIEIIDEQTDKNNKVIGYGALKELHFIKAPITVFLSTQSQKDYMENVDVSTVESKISGLIYQSRHFLTEMEYNQNAFKNIFKLY